MTNLEKWNFILKDKPSPQIWVDLGWYGLVSACLQRRVWYGNLSGEPLFCNLYIVFCGPPSTGKNLVLSPIRRAILYWPKNPAENPSNIPDAGELSPRLINLGPDATSYEQLIERLSGATARFVYSDDASGKEKVYAHASMAFVLTELNSLFRRNQENISKCLLKTYDCEDYNYETKHCGKNAIRKTCVAMIAGCTPVMLKDAAKYDIFSDGFTSRTLFSFESEPRHTRFHIGDLSPDQLKLFDELLSHVKRLAGVFGQLTYSPECYQYLEDWYQEVEIKRKLASLKMQGYFGRCRVHILKLAAAIHFSESFSLEITLKDFQRAAALLKVLEDKMAIGFAAIGRNELYHSAREILGFIRAKHGASFAEIVSRFSSEVTIEEITSLLQTLQFAGDVSISNNKYVTI